MSSIEIKNLSLTYENTGISALNKLNFSVKHNEFLCILGASGSGKTSILNLIAGFLKPSAGSILISNKIPAENAKGVGMVFQEHNLFPWKTVYENIEFGPRINNIEENKRREIAGNLLKEISLEGFENSFPDELSGGMKQRVGIARALANNPEVLLMDEPFGSLDAQTRMQMQEFLLSLWEKEKKTVVFVTHDIDEAILLADRIIVLTKAPARVKEEITVNIPRPRKYSATTTKKFVKIKKQLLKILEN